MSKVYYVKGLVDGQEVDSQAIRNMLPENHEEARKVIGIVQDSLVLEEQRENETVTIDVSHGTYVRAVRFNDDGSFTLLFNEGTEKRVDSSLNFYRIGEKTFRLHDDDECTVDLNSSKHVMALNRLLKYKSSMVNVPNQLWIDVLYDELPQVRDNYPDVFYNMYDGRRIASRDEHFRLYVTKGVGVLLESIEDRPYSYVCMVAYSPTSASILKNLVQGANVKRNYSIDVVHASDDIEHETRGKYYYFSDFWLRPVDLKLKIVAGPRNIIKIDEKISVGLDLNEKYVTENSTYVYSQYMPILDSYFDGDNAYGLRSTDYWYSQLQYVPHKPWSIVAMSIRDSSAKIRLKDNCDLSYPKRVVNRNAMLARQAVISSRRNYKMADEITRSKMVNQREFEQLIFSLFKCDDVTGWYYDKIMKQPVPLKIKMLSHDDQTITQSIDLIVKVAKMDDAYSYTKNEMTVMGWTDNIIARALAIGLITAWKEGTSHFYSKYEVKVIKSRNVFVDVSIDNISTITPKGAVIKKHPRNQEEGGIAVFPAVDQGEIVGNYVCELPDSVDHANSDRVDDYSLSYKFSRSPMESINPKITVNEVKKVRFIKKKKARRGRRRFNKGKGINEIDSVNERQQLIEDNTVFDELPSDERETSEKDNDVKIEVESESRIEEGIQRFDSGSMDGLLFSYVPGIVPDFISPNSSLEYTFKPVSLPAWPRGST